MNVRNGEQDKTWFRSKRIFKVQDKYYFSTREEEDVGPFDSFEKAEDGLKAFIDAIVAGQSVDAARNAAVDGLWVSYHFH